MTAGTEGWLHAGRRRRRRGEVGLYGFLWVLWSWWTDNTGHMKHKDSEEMLSGVTLLEVYSHIHTVMKKKAKRGRRWDENIATVRKWRRGGRYGKSCVQDLRTRRGNMMDSYEYCMIGTQENIWVDGMDEGHWSCRWVRMRKPDLAGDAV